MIPEADWHARPSIPMLPVEKVPVGEPEAIERMIATLQAQLRERYQGTAVLRDAHPKHHGLVNASFIVDKHCPADMRHGLFRAPRQFDAQIRFSNGHPIVNHDLKSDLRGIAIKLSGVGTESLLGDDFHDFLLATGEAFFGKDAVDFVDFPQASDSSIKSIWYFVRGFRVRGGWQLVKGLKRPASPLAVAYFSQTPYRLGPHCVKYQVRPSRPRASKGDPWYLKPVVRHLLGWLVALLGVTGGKTTRLVPGFDALRDSMARDLAQQSVTLELLVQRWSDLSHLPVWAIENATRRWAGPWVKVATLAIHQQTDIRDRDAHAEHMSFTPWRVQAAHQPLGSINRARLRIYSEMAAFRSGLNHIRQANP
jgi:hypothetical protein